MDDEEQASSVSTAKSEEAQPPKDPKSSSVKLPIPDFKDTQQERESNPES
jgi:hypothetical protein